MKNCCNAHQKMALSRCVIAHAGAESFLCTSSSCRWTSLARIVATPLLFRNGPSSHPVCESCCTIIRSGCGDATRRIGASFPMNFATPRLFGNGPSSLPIGISVCAIVRISRWSRRWSLSWELCRAAFVMDPAAPYLLACVPRGLFAHCTIVRINWARGSWRRGRRRGWGRSSRKRSRWPWSWQDGWRRRRRNCHCGYHSVWTTVADGQIW
jgi:hypothetical protein